MANQRRAFLKKIVGLGGILALSGAEGSVAKPEKNNTDSFGVLVDTTLCVGCRGCEKACNRINRDLPGKNARSFDDRSVFNERRRMTGEAYTVVNRYENPKDPSVPIYAKFQCMHCLKPACVSACIVGAFSRDASGAVVYDAWKCIGCRYCMVACPFQVPAYEYNNVLTPQVRKCTFCFEARLSNGKIPACIQSCPMQVMTFGHRDRMIEIGRQKIRRHPDRYLDHIYGEHEIGGTAWMALSGVSFETIDLPRLGVHPVPEYTESIQHAIFKWFLPPAALYGTLGATMWFFKNRQRPSRDKA